MPAPKALVPTEHLHVKLEAPIRAQMDLHLYSPLEERVPKGAHKAFLEGLIRAFFHSRTLPLEAHGFPPGYYIQGPAEMVEALERRLSKGAIK
jgi:hypothetical protein